MKTNNELRVRRSIQELQKDYEEGNKKPLEDLMRAWKGIKELPPDNPQSFFILGGYHGEPFRGPGTTDRSYWGGYCNHGNILFPTWHRVYLLKLEEALQSMPGCEDVMLPYWDETSDDSLKNGIPWALTQENFVLDGETIPNPLRSFVFNKNITDNINGENQLYSKPKGYETVRYPLSGLVGNDADRAATEQHNAQHPDYDENVKILNDNIVHWLNWYIVKDGKPVTTDNVKKQYTTCLDAPNYTVFSNTTSAAKWNENLDSGTTPVVPLESPHNSIHLAVGGFEVPNQGNHDIIPGANGDMGENDTAGLDPIFYFHHAFVDRVFWLWQKKHGFTDNLEVIPEYPGTDNSSNRAQGPTPGTDPNTKLNLESPLDPFQKEDGTTYTSCDCINIEKQLGYTYSQGSLEEQTERAVLQQGQSTKVIRVSGINRARIRGSFLISAYANIGGRRYHVGTEAVLSRWSVQYCANCQTHLEAGAFIPLHGFREESLKNAEYEVELHTRDGVLKQDQLRASDTSEKKLFHLEVR
jgi:tyrosinase